jgi:hypothetical protein
MATLSMVIFIQPLHGGEGQAGRGKIQIAPEFEDVLRRFFPRTINEEFTLTLANNQQIVLMPSEKKPSVVIFKS